MFEKRKKKHSGSIEPVERTGNVWRKKFQGYGMSGNWEYPG